MRKIEAKNIDKNVIKLIGQDWMLVTAGDQEKFNMMTASWGSMGYLWNKPVVMVFVRPQRYTFEFTEKKDEFTLSFFDEKYRHALNVCGSVSGRNVNKVQESGLTPYFTEAGNPAFEVQHWCWSVRNYILTSCRKRLFWTRRSWIASTARRISTKCTWPKLFMLG